MKKRFYTAMAVSLLVVGVSYAFRPSTRDVAPDAEPKEILNRLWFDRLPDKAPDTYTPGLFFAGGIGLYETGSRYRSAYELFEFERRGAALDVTFLQDGRKVDARYKIAACDEKPPFNLCLDFENAPMGPKRLYGFSFDDEESKAIPWAKELKSAGRAKSGLR